MQNFGAPVLQGVLDAMQDMLCVLDLSRNIVLTNKSFRDCFGDLAGSPCFALFQSRSYCMNCISQRALDTGSSFQKHRRLLDRIYQINASPFYDDEGNAIGTVEIFRDITKEYQQQDALRLQNKRLLRESNLAARMQRELFLAQGVPDERVEMYSRYLPASSLGGDMFGCLRQRNGRIGFYIADVSGHGMAAAMITLLLANILRGTQAKTAVQFLYRAREAFLSMVKDEQLYVSMFVAMLDPSTGELSWANAGLNAVPMLVSGEKLERLYSPAMPLCNWEDEILYREHRGVMEPGARLFLYTDGLVDERCSSLTEAELEKEMMKTRGDGLLKKLERHVKQDHEDDVCMLLITRACGDE